VKCQEHLDFCDTGCSNVSAGMSVSRSVHSGLDSRHLATVIRPLLASDHVHSHGVCEILRKYQQRKKLPPDGKMCHINLENLLDEGFGFLFLCRVASPPQYTYNEFLTWGACVGCFFSLFVCLFVCFMDFFYFTLGCYHSMHWTSSFINLFQKTV